MFSLKATWLYITTSWLHCLHQELFISRITKTISKVNKLSKRKKRGWFTKEQMAKTLQWSSTLCSTQQQYAKRFSPNMCWASQMFVGSEVSPCYLNISHATQMTYNYIYIYIFVDSLRCYHKSIATSISGATSRMSLSTASDPEMKGWWRIQPACISIGMCAYKHAHQS